MYGMRVLGSDAVRVRGCPTVCKSPSVLEPSMLRFFVNDTRYSFYNLTTYSLTYTIYVLINEHLKQVKSVLVFLSC